MMADENIVFRSSNSYTLGVKIEFQIIRATCKTLFSLNLYVMFEFLSSEYQLYACGKNSSHALALNEIHHFAKSSINQNDYSLVPLGPELQNHAPDLLQTCFLAEELAADNQRSTYQQTGDFKEMVRTSHQGFWK